MERERHKDGGTRDIGTRHRPRRLRDLIRLDVVGSETPGPIPSEPALMTDFHASRTSLRAALAILALDGHIERRRGQGTFRVAPHPSYDLTIPPRGSLGAYRQRAAGLTPRTLHRSWEKTPPPIARRLSPDDHGDQCLVLEYVLMDRCRPVAVITNYLRGAEGRRTEGNPFATSFYAFLLDSDVEIADQTTTIETRHTDPETAALLDIPAGSVVFGFEQEIRDSAGEVIDIALGVFRSDVRLVSGGSRAARAEG